MTSRPAPDPLGLLKPAHAQPQRRQCEEVLDVVVVDAAQPVHGLGQRREREAAERDIDQHRPKIEGARGADKRSSPHSHTTAYPQLIRRSASVTLSKAWPRDEPSLVPNAQGCKRRPPRDRVWPTRFVRTTFAAMLPGSHLVDSPVHSHAKQVTTPPPAHPAVTRERPAQRLFLAVRPGSARATAPPAGANRPTRNRPEASTYPQQAL